MERRRCPVRVGLAACGVVGVALFALADVAGAALHPHYSMASQVISELTAKGAPYRSQLIALFVGHAAFVIPFVWGIHWSIGDTRRANMSAPLLATLAGLLAIVLKLQFPCERGCVASGSAANATHTAIAILVALLAFASILCFGLRFAQSRRWKAYRLYCYGSACAGAVLAASTVSAFNTPFVGLLERAVAIVYLQWVVWTASTLAAQRYKRRVPRLSGNTGIDRLRRLGHGPANAGIGKHRWAGAE